MEEDNIPKLQITLLEDFDATAGSSGISTEQKIKRSPDDDSENDFSDIDSELEQANEEFLNFHLYGEGSFKKPAPVEASSSGPKKQKQKANRKFTSKLPPHLKGRDIKYNCIFYCNSFF